MCRMSSLVTMVVQMAPLAVTTGFWALRCISGIRLATISLEEKATGKLPAKQGANKLTSFSSLIEDHYRVNHLEDELACSQQKVATLQQELNQQHQDQAAQIQQLLQENATLKSTIRMQAAAGSLVEQQLHDQVRQEQHRSSSLSSRLLQSQHDSMIAAGQSLCQVAQAGEARIALLEESNAALLQERDVLAVMCSALTAQLSSSSARGTFTSQLPAAEGALLAASKPSEQQQEEVTVEQRQEQQFILQPCSPKRCYEPPCISESVWCSSGSARSSSGSCCSVDSETGEVWSFYNSAWEC